MGERGKDSLRYRVSATESKTVWGCGCGGKLQLMPQQGESLTRGKEVKCNVKKKRRRYNIGVPSM